MAARKAVAHRTVSKKDDGSVECVASFSLNEAFRAFCGDVPLKQLSCLSNPGSAWRWFEAGAVGDPTLLLLPGVSGTAASFFLQVLYLSKKGFRVLSVQWPAFDSLNSFLKGLDDFVSHLHRQALEASKKSAGRVSVTRDLHLVGEGLGGLLSLHYAAMRPQQVKTVALCNSFPETGFLLDERPALRIFVAPFVHFLPHAALKQIIIANFLKPLKPLAFWTADSSSDLRGKRNDEEEDWSSSVFAEQRQRSAEADGTAGQSGKVESLIFVPQESLDVKNSKEFLISRLDELSAAEISSRLALFNSVDAAKPAPQLEAHRLLVIHSLDSALPEGVEEQILALYPTAKVATLRSGGPYPFLSAADEVSMHLELHMRRCGVLSSKTARTAPTDEEKQPSVPRNQSSRETQHQSRVSVHPSRSAGDTSGVWREACELLPRETLCFVRLKQRNVGSEEEPRGAWDGAEAGSDCSSRSSVTSSDSQTNVPPHLQHQSTNADADVLSHWLPVVPGGFNPTDSKKKSLGTGVR